MRWAGPIHHLRKWYIDASRIACQDARSAKITFKGSFIYPLMLICAFVPGTMPKTRSTNARPDREECLENAVLRGRVKKLYEKAQQEEAFKEHLKLMGANRGKLAYGTINKLIKKNQRNGFNTINWQSILYYRLEKMKKTRMQDSMIRKNLSVSDTTVVLNLTGETTFDNSVKLTETNSTINTN